MNSGKCLSPVPMQLTIVVAHRKDTSKYPHALSHVSTSYPDLKTSAVCYRRSTTKFYPYDKCVRRSASKSRRGLQVLGHDQRSLNTGISQRQDLSCPHLWQAETYWMSERAITIAQPLCLGRASGRRYARSVVWSDCCLRGCTGRSRGLSEQSGGIRKSSYHQRNITLPRRLPNNLSKARIHSQMRLND